MRNAFLFCWLATIFFFALEQPIYASVQSSDSDVRTISSDGVRFYCQRPDDELYDSLGSIIAGRDHPMPEDAYSKFFAVNGSNTITLFNDFGNSFDVWDLHVGGSDAAKCTIIKKNTSPNPTPFSYGKILYYQNNAFRWVSYNSASRTSSIESRNVSDGSLITFHPIPEGTKTLIRRGAGRLGGDALEIDGQVYIYGGVDMLSSTVAGDIVPFLDQKRNFVTVDANSGVVSSLIMKDERRTSTSCSAGGSGVTCTGAGGVGDRYDITDEGTQEQIPAVSGTCPSADYLFDGDMYTGTCTTVRFTDTLGATLRDDMDYMGGNKVLTKVRYYILKSFYNTVNNNVYVFVSDTWHPDFIYYLVYHKTAPGDFSLIKNITPTTIPLRYGFHVLSDGNIVYLTAGHTPDDNIPYQTDANGEPVNVTVTSMAYDDIFRMDTSDATGNISIANIGHLPMKTYNHTVLKLGSEFFFFPGERVNPPAASPPSPYLNSNIGYFFTSNFLSWKEVYFEPLLPTPPAVTLDFTTGVPGAYVPYRDYGVSGILFGVRSITYERDWKQLRYMRISRRGYAWRRDRAFTTMPLNLYYRPGTLIPAQKVFVGGGGGDIIRLKAQPVYSLPKDNTTYFQGNISLTSTDKALNSIVFFEAGETYAPSRTFQYYSEDFFKKTLTEKVFEEIPGQLYTGVGENADSVNFRQSMVHVPSRGTFRTLFKYYGPENNDFYAKSINFTLGSQTSLSNGTGTYQYYPNFYFDLNVPNDHKAAFYDQNGMVTPNPEDLNSASFQWKKSLSPGVHNIHMLVLMTPKLTYFDQCVKSNLYSGRGGPLGRAHGRAGGRVQYYTMENIGLTGAYTPGPYKASYQAYTFKVTIPEFQNISSDALHPTRISSKRPMFFMDKTSPYSMIDFYAGDNYYEQNDIARTLVRDDNLPLNDPRVLNGNFLSMAQRLNDIPYNFPIYLWDDTHSILGRMYPYDNFNLTTLYSPKSHFLHSGFNGEILYQPQLSFPVRSDRYKLTAVSTDPQDITTSAQGENRVSPPPAYFVVQNTPLLSIFNAKRNASNQLYITGGVIFGGIKPYYDVRVNITGGSAVTKYARADVDGNFSLIVPPGTASFSFRENASQSWTNIGVNRADNTQAATITIQAGVSPKITNFVSGQSIYTQNPIIEGIAQTNFVGYTVYYKNLEPSYALGTGTRSMQFYKEKHELVSLPSPTNAAVPLLKTIIDRNALEPHIVERGFAPVQNGTFSFMLSQKNLSSITDNRSGIFYIEVANTSNTIPASDEFSQAWDPNTSIISLRYNPPVNSGSFMTHQVLMSGGATENRLSYDALEKKFHLEFLAASSTSLQSVKLATPAKVRLPKGVFVSLPGESAFTVQNGTNVSLQLGKNMSVFEHTSATMQTILEDGIFVQKVFNPASGDIEATGLQTGDIVYTRKSEEKIYFAEATGHQAVFELPAGSVIYSVRPTTFADIIVDGVSQKSGFYYQNTRFSFDNSEAIYHQECDKYALKNMSGAGSVVDVNTYYNTGDPTPLSKCKTLAMYLFPYFQNPSISFPRNGDTLKSDKKIEIMGYAWPKTTVQILIQNRHVGTAQADKNGQFYFLAPEVYEFQNTADPVSIDVYDTFQESTRISLLTTFSSSGRELGSIMMGPHRATSVSLKAFFLQIMKEVSGRPSEAGDINVSALVQAGEGDSFRLFSPKILGEKVWYYFLEYYDNIF